MKRILAMLMPFALCMAMILTGTSAFAEVPEGYPEIIEGLDFGGDTVYIYDWWSTDDINHSYRSAEPTEEEQLQYDYWDWLEATYNVHVIQTALSGWSENPETLAEIVANQDSSSLCIIAVSSDFAGDSLKNNLYMPWTCSVEESSSATADLMTKNGVCYGRSFTKESEPRYGIFFNKDLLTAAGINWNDLYDAQQDGTWTWSKMESYMAQVQRDVNNDGKIDVWGLTGNFDNLTIGLVASNGGDFFAYNSDGEMTPDLDSTATREALATRKAWTAYQCPREDGDSWDYYEEKWAQGKAAFRVGQAWEGFNGYDPFNQVNWGFVAMPKGPQADHYVNVTQDNVYGVPNVYDETTALKLEQLFTLWTKPVPGISDDSWANGLYDLTDERAVEETYAMLREDENSIAMKYTLLGDTNSILGSNLLWFIDGDESIDEIISAALPAFREICDEFNGVSHEITIELYVPETITAGNPFSVQMSEVEGAHWYGVTVLDENGMIVSENGTDTAGGEIVLCNSGSESLDAGTYSLEYWATVPGASYFMDPVTITVTGIRPEAPDLIIPSEVAVGAQFTIDASMEGVSAYELRICAEGEKEPVYHETGTEGIRTLSLPASGNYFAECWIKTDNGWSMPKTATIHATSLGTLADPVIIGETHFETNETVQFRFYAEGAESYTYKISGAGYNWGPEGSTDESGEVEISLSEGGYNLTVYSNKAGWDSGKTETVFSVGAAPEPPVITVSQETVYHGESFYIYIDLRNADSYECEVQYDPSDPGSIGGFSGDDNRPECQWSFSMPGKHFIRAYSTKDGIRSAWTTVYVTDLEETAPEPDKLNSPIILSKPVSIQIGAVFAVEAEFDSRSRYSTLFLYDPNGNYVGFSHNTGDQITFSGWNNDCEPGIYHAVIVSYGEGYENSDPAEFDITVIAGDRPAAPVITISPENPEPNESFAFVFDRVYDMVNVDIYRSSGSRYSGTEEANTDRIVWYSLSAGDWVVHASVCVGGIWSEISETPFTVGGGSGSSDSGTCGENVSWTLNPDGHLMISGTGAMTDYDWQTFAPWTQLGTEVTSVTVGEGVTHIGNMAFYTCFELTDTVLPDSLTSIGDEAFYMTQATNVILPADVREIGNWAFGGAGKIYADAENPYFTSVGDLLFNNAQTILIHCPDGLTSVTVPDGTTMIDQGAFISCYSLQEVILPDSITQIGTYAFAHCTSLQQIALPDGMTSIAASTFRYCTGMTDLYLPGTVTTIGYGAFENCSGLTDVHFAGTEDDWSAISISESNEYLLNAEKHFISRDTLILPSGLLEVGDSAFEGSACEVVIIPDGCVKIGHRAFANCRNLIRVEIPASVTDIAEDAFAECPNLDPESINK